MIKQVCFVVVVLALATEANAQNSSQSSASGSTWMEIFVGPDGTVLYPQYGWALKGSRGGLSGYGFVEQAPHEPFFTNHLVIYCPPSSPICAHTETGGAPGKNAFHFQAGPRINLHALRPFRGKIHHLFVTQLPGLVGARPPNTLISGGTNRFKVAPKFALSFEGYRRFFPGKRPDYGEYWLLVHPAWKPPVDFGAFVLQSGRRAAIAVGVRITPFK